MFFKRTSFDAISNNNFLSVSPTFFMHNGASNKKVGNLRSDLVEALLANAQTK